MESVACGGHAGRAREAHSSQGPPETQVPAWTKMIGAARAMSAWRASDPFGDQDGVMVAFRYPDGAEHCLLVLVDHLLGGIAKDATILDAPLGEVLGMWDGAEFDLVEEGIADAAGRVLAARAGTAATLGATITADYTETLAPLR